MTAHTKPQYDNLTSRPAYEDVQRSLSVTERAVMLTLKRLGPSTADEIAYEMGIDRLTVRPRLTSLKDVGKVEKTRATRRNISGKSARLWKVTA